MTGDRGLVEIEVALRMAMPYRRELVPNIDGTWFGRVVEFPGCMTDNHSVYDALLELEDAMKSWLWAKITHGEEIPDPEKGRFGGSPHA